MNHYYLMHYTEFPAEEESLVKYHSTLPLLITSVVERLATDILEQTCQSQNEELIC